MCHYFYLPRKTGIVLSLKSTIKRSIKRRQGLITKQPKDINQNINSLLIKGILKFLLGNFCLFIQYKFSRTLTNNRTTSKLCTLLTCMYLKMNNFTTKRHYYYVLMFDSYTYLSTSITIQKIFQKTSDDKDVFGFRKKYITPSVEVIVISTKSNLTIISTMGIFICILQSRKAKPLAVISYHLQLKNKIKSVFFFVFTVSFEFI